MTQVTQTSKEEIKAAQKAKEAADTEYEKAQNANRSGKGTRVTVGYTRGRSTTRITYEAFDETQPDTLPADLAEFLELTKSMGGKDEKNVLAWVIDGFNSSQYTAASDPIAEFVEASWPEDIQKNFRLVVRNYSQATGVSLEDSVKLIKPGIEAAQKKA